MTTQPSSKQIVHKVGNFSRSVESKLNDFVTLTDFGALGDNNASSTSVNNVAISAALDYMLSTGYSVLVPPGIYYCDPFTINNTAYGEQGQFIGIDRERCILKRNGTGSGAFITIGGSSNTLFQAGINFSNIRIDGGAKTNGPAFLGYDIVRSKFTECDFNGGSIACSLKGGISITFSGCIFQNAQTGIKIDKFTSAAGGGWPNLIHIDGGEIVDNTTVGLWFDGGRMITLSHVDVEGNGTTVGTIGQGGIYIGSTVGDEVAINDTISIGLTINDCWFESNKGYADIHVKRGMTSVSNSTFYSALSTYDIRIDGENYHINNINCSFPKQNNFSEGTGAGTGYGNVIAGSQIPTLEYNSNKTTVFGHGLITLRNGSIPTVEGIARPNIQFGFATSDATGIVTVTFPTAYTNIPYVKFTPLDATTKRVISVKLTAVNAIQFTAETAYVDTSAGPVVGAVGFYWEAIGNVALV